MGTGAYGSSNPTVVNCGFKPKMFLVMENLPSYVDGGNSGYLKRGLVEYDGNTKDYQKIDTGSVMIFTDQMPNTIQTRFSSNYRYFIHFNFTDNGISYYETGSTYTSGEYQFNYNGRTYIYLAFGNA